MRKLILIAATAASLATPALAEGTTCVRRNDIYNWTALNDKQVVIENYRHQRALLKLIGTCSGLRFDETIAIGSRGSSDLDCVGPGDSLTARNRGIGGRCAVVSVTPFNGPLGKHDHHANGPQEPSPEQKNY
jgi:hypothetical protein